MKAFKKKLLFFLALALTLSVFSIGVFSESVNLGKLFSKAFAWNVSTENFSAALVGDSSEEEEYSCDCGNCMDPDVKSGSCGINVRWEFDGVDTLAILGIGDMEDFHDFYQARWYQHQSKIKKVIIEDGVTHIGDLAFEYCTNLTHIEIPDSVTSIGYGAFMYCKSLENLELPNSVISLGTGFYGSAIYNDESNWDGNVLYYGDYLLEKKNGEDLKTLEVKEGTKYISSKLAYKFSDLESVIIPESVVYIGESAFADCQSLKSVVVENAAVSISKKAFENCTSLTDINLGNNVVSIDETAFSNTAYYNESQNWEDDVLYIGKYLIKSKTKNISYEIKEGTIGIADYAFSGSDLNSITIPDSVVFIGKSSFYSCKKLTNVVIPDSVVSIGDYAFYSCEKLTNVVIPDSVPSIESFTFAHCYGIKSITIGNSVKSIGDRAFLACTSLSSIQIGTSVTSIEQMAFSGCNILKSIIVPASVTSIGIKAIGYNEYSNKISYFTIIGKKDSVAEKYATEIGVEFVELDNPYFPESEIYFDFDTATMPNLSEKATANDVTYIFASNGISATITDKNGSAFDSSAFVGTGFKVKTEDGEFTVIVKGDVDGSGCVDAVDYLKVKGSLLGQVALTDEFALAADADGDNELAATDYLKIKGYFLGQFDLYE